MSWIKARSGSQSAHWEEALVQWLYGNKTCSFMAQVQLAALPVFMLYLTLFNNVKWKDRWWEEWQMGKWLPIGCCWQWRLNKPQTTPNIQLVANTLLMLYKRDIRHISNISSPSEKKIMLTYTEKCFLNILYPHLYKWADETIQTSFSLTEHSLIAPQTRI